jgi:putative selenium metabolism protein SsnA
VIALVGGTTATLDPPRVEKADVVIDHDRIVQVGGEIPSHASRVDASGCLVMPGFVVGHTHLYSALACGMPPPAVPPTTFLEILQRVWWKLDRALDDTLVEVSAMAGAIEAAKRGVTCVIDHHASPNAIDGSLDRIASALGQVGIRGILCYETSDRDGRERRNAGLTENHRFAKRCREDKSLPLRAMFGAHAPFTLEDDTLAELSTQASWTGAPLHIHVAEGPDDGDDAAKRGTTVGARLLSAIGPGGIVAHAVHLDAETRATLERAGVWVVTNARSNMTNAVGLAPPSGSRVAMGTDGIGADMIAEAQAHFFRHAEAKDGLAMDAIARIVGAQKLAARRFDGEERAPRIAAGERADLVVLAYDPPTPLTADNLAGHFLFGLTSACVRDTIAGGRFVLKHGVVQGIDTQAFAAKARVEAARLWSRMDGASAASAARSTPGKLS